MSTDPESGDSRSGGRVLLIRPAAARDELVAAIEALGLPVAALPVIAIRELPRQGQVESIFEHLADYHKAVFVSRAAARIGARAIAGQGLQLPERMEFFAVGATTAAILETALLATRGKSVFLPLDRADSEGLLALPQMQRVAGQRILIFRGSGGREALADGLRQRGAAVTYVELYCREPDSSHRYTIRRLLETNDLGVVIAHSGELIMRLLEEVGSQLEPRLLLRPIVVPGQRLAAIARYAGFSEVVVASSAVTADMVDAVRRWYTEPPKISR